MKSVFCTSISNLFFLESLRLMFASNYASHLSALFRPVFSALDKVENAIES